MGMTRLDLAQRLWMETDVGGAGISSTENQTGEYLKLVTWVDDFYNRLQTSKELWQFLRKSFSIAITSGTSEYTPSAVSITDHANWIDQDVRCRLTASGVSGEQEIYFVEWADFKRTWLFGSSQEQTGRPVHFTIKPDKSIQFWPVPDDSYTITGEYYRTPFNMSTEDEPDEAEPAFPDRFHMVIVWGALLFYGANYVENSQYTHGSNEYKEMLTQLEFDQLPRMGFGGSLA